MDTQSAFSSVARARVSLSDNPKRGFALLVTIVLVVFLVLILIGLATFTKVETQVADNTGQAAKARQNALIGLNMAIGQLQRHAGPDERVTARSEIKPAEITGNPQDYITGVWSTAGGALTDTPDAWLVSGTETNPNAVTGILDPATGGTSYDTSATNAWVFVVYNNSVGAGNPTRRVRLATQPLQVPANTVPGLGGAGNATIGNYAFWVGDEGVKASLSMSNPNLGQLDYDNGGASGDGGDDWSVAGAGELRDRLAQLAPGRFHPERTFGSLDYSVGSTADEMSRLLTLDQLRLVTGGPPLATWQNNFHSFTPLARGILADTDGGGLRRDISARALTSTNTALNDYWVLRPSAATGFNATYDLAPHRAPVANSSLAFSVAPVLSEAGIFFHFAGDGTNIELKYSLSAELWNPYAATLSSATKNLRVRVNTTSDITFTANDGATPHALTLNAGDIAIAELGSAALAPGSITQYHEDASGQLVTTGTAALTNTGVSAASAAAVVDVDYPAVPADNIRFFLEIESSAGTWEILQTFELPVSNGATDSIPVSGYAGGYGFELNRNLLLWTLPGTADARDPRSTTFTAAAHFEPIATGHWTDDPSDTKLIASIAGDEPLANSELLPLFDLPRQEIVSLAQLRHMIGDNPYEALRGTTAVQTEDRDLWDEAFVSTVPRNVAPADWDPAVDPRPNRFLEVYFPPEAPAGEFDSRTNQLTSLRTESRSARYQLIRGSFNINSTSAAAWEAVLGATLRDWDTQDDAPAELRRAFFRTPHGAQEAGLSKMVDTDAATTAFPALDNGTARNAFGRLLTSGELQNLANNIRLQIIARGRPFESLAEFAASNVLANAIAAADLNGTAIANDEYEAAAGALTPSDILAAIAPFIAARSDTFLVRSYGDVVNPVTSEVTGRAWCEAVVQRLPDLAEDPDAAVDDVVTADPATFPFGRKFKIVFFRWLTPADL